MTTKRNVEIFSAGCAVCEDAISLVKRIACPSCEVTVADMNQTDVAQRAKTLGIQQVPAVAVDGKLAACCQDKGLNEQTLRSAGLGQPVV